MMRRAGTAALLGGALSIIAGSLLAQAEFDFMPDGGRQTLLRLFEGSFADLTVIAASTHDAAEWQHLLASKAGPDMRPEEIETLASYLAVNLPLPADQIAAAQNAEALTAVFPPDGKELAIANCQFCHSFFTGYLTHDRDVEGWRGVFKPPYHSELPMSAKERETFSFYSAINMPIPYQDVPEALRF
jgi:hypothetical protein